MIPALLAASLTAGAQAPDRHQALFLEARSAESERHFEDAVTACTALLDEAPDGPRAGTCRERLDWLSARRDTDGDFGGWTELSEVRATWRDLDPDDAAARIAALREREDLAELVAVDAGLWLARDALLRRDDPVAAERITGPLAAEHHGELRNAVVGLHAQVLAALGREQEALVVEDEIRVAPPGIRPTPVEEMVRTRRHRRVAVASGGLVGLYALVAAPLAWRGRAAGRPWGLIPLAVATLGAWALAEAWSDDAGVAVPWMGLGFGLVHLLSGPALHGTEGAVRSGLRGLALAATLAVAWLALWWTHSLDWVLP